MNKTEWKKWTEIELNFLIENYPKYGLSYIVKNIDRSKNSIIHKRVELKIPAYNPREKSWTAEEEKILDVNYVLYGIKYCMKLLNRTRFSITRKIAKSEVCTIRQHDRRNKISEEYNVNPDHFTNIVLPEVAYILGYIWADGHVVKTKDSITMTIAKEDLDVIKCHFDKTGNWSTHIRNPKKNSKPNHKVIATISTNNKVLSDFLKSVDFTIKSGTSADKIISLIPEHLKHYFFLGYSDGDGCWYISKDYKTRQHITAACYEQNWNFMYELFIKLNIKTYCHKLISNKHGKGSSVTLSSKEAVKIFGNYIYQDYEKNKIGLIRKYSKYKQISESYS